MSLITCENDLLVVYRTLTELVDTPREKPFADDEPENNLDTTLTTTQPEADMLALVFANILR